MKQLNFSKTLKRLGFVPAEKLDEYITWHQRNVGNFFFCTRGGGSVPITLASDQKQWWAKEGRIDLRPHGFRTNQDIDGKNRHDPDEILFCCKNGNAVVVRDGYVVEVTGLFQPCLSPSAS